MHGLSWERKTLIVLLTDICGSTALSRRIELETYAGIFQEVEAIWTEAARRHGGVVSRMQGDGCMILFGLQQPGERDVIDAIDAALYIHDRLRALSVPVEHSPDGLRARSGIHAGMALIRRGNPAQGLYNVMGEAPNIAGTLEKHAQAGEVLVTAGSLKPNAGFFQLEPRRVPNVEEDLLDSGVSRNDAAVLHVAGRRPTAQRFEATARRGLTPLIGREDAAQALRAFASAPSGQSSRVAVLTAAAGHGKTRLLREFEHFVGSGGPRVWRGTCESYRETEVLQPFVQMLRARRSAVDSGAEGEVLESALARPTVDGFARLLGRAAADAPLLLVIDDWQWADDASRRLLQALLDQSAPLRVLLAARPSAEGAEWVHDAIQLRLEPWTEAQTAQAMRRWLPDADPLLVTKLHQYAGGVPLLVEELCHSTSSLRLWRALDGQGTSRETGLRLLVASRLARLGEPLMTAVQAASIIGSQLPHWLLQEVCGWQLTDAQLLALAEADFIYPDAGPESLRFKHGLTRDAVYEHLGLALRQTMHRRARVALEARSAGSPEALAALAYHCDGAGEPAAAARYAERAGHEALKAFSMDLARGHYRRAMTSLEQLEPSTERDLHWCALACRFAMASIFDPLALGNDARVFERAVALARVHGDEARLAECLYWLGYMLYGFGRYREAVAREREALALSTRLGYAALASQAEATLGEILVGTCDYDEALQRIDAAVRAKRERAGPQKHGLAVGSAYALACKGSVLADRGRFDAAQSCFDEAIELLGASTHPVGNSVRNWISVAHLWQGNWVRARDIANESVRIAENTGALYLLAVSRSTLGFARWCETGDPQGLELMADAVRWMAARHGRMFTSLHFGWLVEAYVAEGRLSEARPLAAHVLRRARQGERMGEAIAARAMAYAAAVQDEPRRAEQWLQRAERSASARGSLREHALNGLARAQLAQWQGRGDAAAATNDALGAIAAIGVRLPRRWGAGA